MLDWGHFPWPPTLRKVGGRIGTLDDRILPRAAKTNPTRISSLVRTCSHHHLSSYEPRLMIVDTRTTALGNISLKPNHPFVHCSRGLEIGSMSSPQHLPCFRPPLAIRGKANTLRLLKIADPISIPGLNVWRTRFPSAIRLLNHALLAWKTNPRVFTFINDYLIYRGTKFYSIVLIGHKYAF